MAFRIREMKLSGGTRAIKNTIQSLFGGIRLCPLEFGVKEVNLAIHQALPNFYQSSQADEEKCPLFVLTPDVIVANVWPDDLSRYDDIRFGTAVTSGRTPITHAVVFHKGETGIYICMTPLSVDVKLEVGYLGI